MNDHLFAFPVFFALLANWGWGEIGGALFIVLLLSAFKVFKEGRGFGSWQLPHEKMKEKVEEDHKEDVKSRLQNLEDHLSVLPSIRDLLKENKELLKEAISGGTKFRENSEKGQSQVEEISASVVEMQKVFSSMSDTIGVKVQSTDSAIVRIEDALKKKASERVQTAMSATLGSLKEKLQAMDPKELPCECTIAKSRTNKNPVLSNRELINQLFRPMGEAMEKLLVVVSSMSSKQATTEAIERIIDFLKTISSKQATLHEDFLRRSLPDKSKD
jgi:hypothetical protein